jgi:ApaG protein
MATILTPYQAETHGIVVTVMPAFLARESDPAEQTYMWGYNVRIRNTRPDSVQLRDRHWIIYDGLGRKEEVRGEGVIGEQPIIKPGTFYDYKSGVPLTTPSGLMSGQYRFTTSDGSEFWVDIPAFSLDSPHDDAVKH